MLWMEGAPHALESLLAYFLRVVLVVALVAGAYLVFRKDPGPSTDPTTVQAPAPTAAGGPTPHRSEEPPAPPVQGGPSAERDPATAKAEDRVAALAAEAAQPSATPSGPPMTPSEVETLFSRAVEEMAADDGVDALGLQVALLDRIQKGEITKEGVVRGWVRLKQARKLARGRAAEEERQEKERSEREAEQLAKERATRTYLADDLSARIRTFYASRVRLPNDLTELQKREAFNPIDAWDRLIRYERRQNTLGRGYRLTSAGRDGQFGTPDDIDLETEVRPAR
jgi:hypothetical protein